MENNKGITMISLAITVVILMLLTGVITVNVTKQINIKNINKLYSDIEVISSKISDYYLKTGNLPIYENKYVNSKEELIQKFKQYTDNSYDASQNINVNDADDGYYVINLSLLDNLTLNYGYDYKNWQSTSLYDYYIINTATHQIYYPYGIQLGGEYYFTKYPDEMTVGGATLNSAPNNWIISPISNCTKTDLDNNKISITANVTITGLATANNEVGYDLSSIKYAWTDNSSDTEANLIFTNCTYNTLNNGTINTMLSSKSFANTTQNLYLWIGIMDVNGNFCYKRSNGVTIP